MNEDKLRRILDARARRRAVLRAARHPLALALASRPPVPTRSRRQPSTRCSTSRPSRPRACSGATRTGGVRCGCRSTSSSSAPCCSTTATTATRSRSSARRAQACMMTLFEVAMDLTGRLTSTFLRDSDGKRPVYGGTRLFQEDPHWRDLILFYEYFHGDNGAGLGASHQTGWTGMVARLIQAQGALGPDDVRTESVPLARVYHDAARLPTPRRSRGPTPLRRAQILGRGDEPCRPSTRRRRERRRRPRRCAAPRAPA